MGETEREVICLCILINGCLNSCPRPRSRSCSSEDDVDGPGGDSRFHETSRQVQGATAAAATPALASKVQTAASSAVLKVGGGTGGMGGRQQHGRQYECLAHVCDAPSPVMTAWGLGGVVEGGSGSAGSRSDGSGLSSLLGGCGGRVPERRLRVVPRPPAIPSAGGDSGRGGGIPSGGGGAGSKKSNPADSFHFAVEVRMIVCVNMCGS